MAQNIYDDEAFFEEYGRLARSVEGLNGAVEWPTLHALLPELRGKTVLDLGCGYGWFCRWAREQGAANVHGVDISQKMLARAEALTQDPAITYARADLETLGLPPRAFDLVYSSLAFHYLENLRGVFEQIAGTLIPGGHLVFSVEHPIYTAPIRPGWTTDLAGGRAWLLTAYREEGARSTDWLAPGVLKQHRTLGTYINTLIQLGFALSHVEEWGPSDEQIAAEPARIDDRQRPPFLLIIARR